MTVPSFALPWVARYEALSAQQRAEYGPWAARRWPTAYARRETQEWRVVWQTLLAWIATDELVFQRCCREVENEERQRPSATVTGGGA